MKILFCSNVPLAKNLGAPKVLVELVDELRNLGWHCDTYGPEEAVNSKTYLAYVNGLRDYLIDRADQYDVVDYDHSYLPFSRDTFPPGTLMVGRSVLLTHHFHRIAVPESNKLRSRVRRLLLGRGRPDKQHWLDVSAKTLSEADLVNVCNEHDRLALEESGIDPRKIVVLTFGIGRDRRSLFDAVASEPPASPKVAFVGTFDYRKGATHFGDIMRGVCNGVPEARFKLMGTAGLFQTIEQVMDFIPSGLRDRAEVIPRFAPNDLPTLLSECSVGVFPSYVEGFPFGCLEMLAASLPVIAFDAPGAPEMLPPEWLVPLADSGAMAAKVVKLLNDKPRLFEARIAAKVRSQDFTWPDVARQTDLVYKEAIGFLRAGIR